MAIWRLGVLALCAGLSADVAAVQAKPSPDAELTRLAPERDPALPGKPGFAFGVLGSFEFKTVNHRFQAQWKDVLRRVSDERPLYEACAGGAGKCSPKLKKWRRLLGDLKALPRREQMIQVNRAVNRLVRYRDDSKAFGQRDYWATPLQVFEKGGDCEDFAILKFVSLLDLGFDSDQLRVTIVKDRRRGFMHAVTAVTLDGKTYILDNLNSYAVEQQYVLKYIPLYSANLESQWVHVVTAKIRARFITQVMEQKPAAVEREPTGELPHVAQNTVTQSGAQPSSAEEDTKPPAAGLAGAGPDPVFYDELP